MKGLVTLRTEVEDIEHQLALINADAKPIRDQLSALDKRRGQLLNELGVLRNQINEMKTAPRVSDHAVIRFLERKHGFCFEDVRKKLLTKTVIQAMEMGAEAPKQPKPAPAMSMRRAL